MEKQLRRKDHAERDQWRESTVGDVEYKATATLPFYEFQQVARASRDLSPSEMVNNS